MAEGKSSASGLIRLVEIDVRACAALEWSWRVDRAQASVDLTDKAKEDVAAALFLLFGDPGFLTMPEKVPTLRYVWTGGPQAAGAVIDSPYLPGTVRSLVLRDASAPRARWVTERRDVAADFKMAFPGKTPERIHALALFTDNDQTREPVIAYYGDVRISCRRS